MPSAADNYLKNITFFESLRLRAGQVKVDYSATTGLFSVASGSFLRTMKNIGKTTGKQSVSNDARFHDPVVAVFQRAKEKGVDVSRRNNAYQGLEALRRSYAADADKLAALNKTLIDIKPYVEHTPTGNLVDELQAMFDTINPETALGPLDLEFLDVVWADRARLFKMLDEAELYEEEVNDRSRPYADLASAIYKLYGGHIEPAIRDLNTWVNGLPTMRTGDGVDYFRLQHNKVNLPRANRGLMISNKGYGTDFIYYTRNHDIEGQSLWRIYLNFGSEGAAPILNFLMGKGDGSGIHSFKICGPHCFHTRRDKIVIYVSASKVDGLANELIAKTGEFHLRDPLPGMTIKLSAGVAKGLEPGSFDSGFGRSLDPTQSRRQSYGTIRAQIIAAALTSMHATISEDAAKRRTYMANKNNFLKWAAIAFRSHADVLSPA